MNGRRFLIACAVAVALAPVAALAIVQIETSKINGYATEQRIDQETSKIGGYSVHDRIDQEVSKINAYVVLETAPASRPRLIQ